MKIYACSGTLETSPVGTEGNLLTDRYNSVQTFLRYMGIEYLIQHAKRTGRKTVSVYTYSNFYDNKTFRLIFQKTL
jgi:hypothetical protein